jgi:IS4 transposase
MRHENSLMHDVLKPMPWGAFERVVENHDADRRVRKLTTKSQFIALVYGQLSGAQSLRDIVSRTASQATRLYHLGAKAPKRSTLADANALRPAAIFADVFGVIAAQAHRGLRKASKEALRLIDATSLSLSSLSQDWAAYKAHGCGAKLHLVYDPGAQLPVRFAVTAARINDIVEAKAMPIEAGVTYAFDLGFYDFGWWAEIDTAGAKFVTRLKKNTRTTVLQTRKVPAGSAILADLVIRLPERMARSRKNPMRKPLREVHVKLDTGKVLRIVCNDLKASAKSIADIYKQRWDIELFFRWVKHTLKIDHFIGTSENAVRTQIAVALIVYLLLRLAHAAQTAVESLLTFTRLVSANLMHFRSIHDLANRQSSRQRHDPNQLGLALC